MKKIIGVLGILIVTAVVLSNSNFVNNNDIDLAGLTAMNTANAEEGGWFDNEKEIECETLEFSHYEPELNSNGNWYLVEVYFLVKGEEIICDGWGWYCTPVDCTSV